MLAARGVAHQYMINNIELNQLPANRHRHFNIAIPKPATGRILTKCYRLLKIPLPKIRVSAYYPLPFSFLQMAPSQQVSTQTFRSKFLSRPVRHKLLHFTSNKSPIHNLDRQQVPKYAKT